MTFNTRPIVLIASQTTASIHALIELLHYEYDLKIAITADIALKIVFSNEPPDLILLDMDLSNEKEPCLCKRIKENYRTENIPIIILGTDDKEQTHAFSMGASDYILKPFEQLVLKAKVNTHAHLSVRTKALEKLASIDGLTSIPNRRYFNDRFSEEFKRGQRYNTNIAVIMIDIDYFKQYNDTYGHGSGDDCLRKVALAFKNTLQRPGDIVARYGGEEFVFLLPNTDYNGAMYIAQKVIENIRDLKIKHEKSSVYEYVTISAGIGMSDYVQDKNPESILERADKALYEAKESGRNRVCP